MTSAPSIESNSPVRSAAERAANRVRLTRLESALNWASSSVPAPHVIATSCCGMSLAQGGDVFEALGSAPPTVSARSADLLIVAGTITKRQAPLILDIYERMVEPRWVIAWGVCAISGGPYQNYATIPGLGELLPIDVCVSGCPPSRADFRDALLLLHDRATRSERARSSEAGRMPIDELRELRAASSADLEKPPSADSVSAVSVDAGGRDCGAGKQAEPDFSADSN